jgi:hypothetical protein
MVDKEKSAGPASAEAGPATPETREGGDVVLTLVALPFVESFESNGVAVTQEGVVVTAEVADAVLADADSYGVRIVREEKSQ